MAKTAAITSLRTPPRPRRSLALLGVLALASLASCGDTLGEGEIGKPRLLGFVLGVSPVTMVPPISDRSGNIYLLYGGRSAPDTNAFIVRTGGGVSAGCRLQKGDKVGPIGWAGFATDRAWYWSGGALVALSGFGDCKKVLDKDPVTGSDLLHKAVLPWVSDRPSRTTIVSLVQAASDTAPTTVLVDLDNNIYTTARPFEPVGGTNVEVLGAGGSAKRREGYLVLRFDDGATKRIETRFYDDEGAITSRVGVGGLETVAPYGIAGYLQSNDNGLVAGLVDPKRLLLFDKTSARVVNINNLEASGVHAWKGSLFLVGKTGDRPAIAEIADSGQIASPVEWDTSSTLVRRLAASIVVRDDRTPPAHDTTFGNPTNALGPFPLVTDHSSHPYGEDQTLLVIGGPVVGAGAASQTQLAVVPVGVSYP